MPNHPDFGVLAQVLNRTRAITRYHDHKLDLTASTGRYLTRLPNGQLVYLDEYDDRLRGYPVRGRVPPHRQAATRRVLLS